MTAIHTAKVPVKPKRVVIGNSRPLTLTFQPILKGRDKSGFLMRKPRIAAWARAKVSNEPKTYRAPRSAKNPGLKNPGVSTRRVTRENRMMAGYGVRK